MSAWEVVYARSAQRELQKLPSADQRQIALGVKRFADTETGDVKKLQVDKSAQFRLRVGDWRIFFDKDNGSRTISVVAIRNRKESY